MSYDQERYRSLTLRAAVAFDLFRGTYQDLSQSRRPCTIVGSRWVRANNYPFLSQRAVADGCSTAAVAACVDVTGSFWCEAVLYPRDATTGEGLGRNIILAQYDGVNGGGFRFIWDFTPGNNYFLLDLFDAAANIARSISTPVGSVVTHVPYHVIVASQAGGTAGQAWIKGVPVVATLGGAGVTANIPTTATIIHGTGLEGLSDCGLARATVGQPSNLDVSALWGACRDDLGIFGVVT